MRGETARPGYIWFRGMVWVTTTAVVTGTSLGRTGRTGGPPQDNSVADVAAIKINAMAARLNVWRFMMVLAVETVECLVYS